MEEHLAEQLSGKYGLWEPVAFMRGEKHRLWRGLYGKGSESNVADFVARLPELAPAIKQFVHLMRFHLAQTQCGKRLRKRIEAALAAHLCEQAGLVGGFQDTGIRYAHRRPDEDPIEIRIEWQKRPVGVPDLLMA